MNPDEARVYAGLCADCLLARLIRTGRGSVFYLCGKSLDDPAYAKYPRLPVLKCPAYDPGGRSILVSRSMEPLKILGISGSLRKASFNTAALRAAQQLAPNDVIIETFALDGIPPYNQDHDATPPESVTEFKARIRAADAILFATPEYNYSIPGVLKNAIDYASRPYGDSAWEGKPVAVMGASPGMLGSVRAQYHLRQCFVFLNMYPVNRPEVLIANAAQKFDAEGNLTDEKTREMIARLVQSLADWTRRLK